MNNGKKYEELCKSIRREKDPKDKLDKMAIMLLTMATNDLDGIYKHIKRLWIGIIVLLLVTLFSDQVSISTIITFLAKVF
jgi:hypothetical protein